MSGYLICLGTFCGGKMEGKTVNVIMFNVRGLNLFNGQLKIEASFQIASKSLKGHCFLSLPLSLSPAHHTHTHTHTLPFSSPNSIDYLKN